MGHCNAQPHVHVHTTPMTSPSICHDNRIAPDENSTAIMNIDMGGETHGIIRIPTDLR